MNVAAATTANSASASSQYLGADAHLGLNLKPAAETKEGRVAEKWDAQRQVSGVKISNSKEANQLSRRVPLVTCG
jgi:hypothetical protein